jgi:hypothetical protein
MIYRLSKEYVDEFTFDATRILYEEKIASQKHAHIIQTYIKMLNEKLTLIYNLPLDESFAEHFKEGCEPIMKNFFKELNYSKEDKEFQRIESRLTETVLMQDVQQFIADMHESDVEIEEAVTQSTPRPRM